MEVDLITNLIESYYDIVRDKVIDSVPKAIMHFLVNYVKSSLQNEMVTRLCTVLISAPRILPPTLDS